MHGKEFSKNMSLIFFLLRNLLSLTLQTFTSVLERCYFSIFIFLLKKNEFRTTKHSLFWYCNELCWFDYCWILWKYFTDSEYFYHLFIFFVSIMNGRRNRSSSISFISFFSFISCEHFVSCYSFFMDKTPFFNGEWKI